MQKAHTKNAPRKTARCVKQAYKSVFFKYNFAVFKGFYARQRFQMVTGVNNALMARLEGFFDYNADACNFAACLMGNIGKAASPFARKSSTISTVSPSCRNFLRTLTSLVTFLVKL